MTSRNLLIAVAVAWVAALGGMVWMMGLAGMNFEFLITNLSIMSAFLDLLAALNIGLAVIGGLIPMRALAWVGGAVGLGFGALAALYNEVIVFQAIREIGPVSFRVTTPDHAESFFLLLLGLTSPLLGLALLRLRRG